MTNFGEHKEDALERAAGGAIQLLTFLLDGKMCAVTMEQVLEVIKPGLLTPVPLAPEFIRGVINVRGEILTVVDLRYFLSAEVPQPLAEPYLIISDAGSGPCGFLIEKYCGPLLIESQQIRRPDAASSQSSPRLILGQVPHGTETVPWLDLKGLWELEEIKRLKKWPAV